MNDKVVVVREPAVYQGPVIKVEREPGGFLEVVEEVIGPRGRVLEKVVLGGARAAAALNRLGHQIRFYPPWEAPRHFWTPIIWGDKIRERFAGLVGDERAVKLMSAIEAARMERGWPATIPLWHFRGHDGRLGFVVCGPRPHEFIIMDAWGRPFRTRHEFEEFIV
jgi:hypothetical protein